MSFVLQDHNCVKELRALIHSQQQKMGDFQKEITDYKFQLNQQKREIHLLKVSVHSYFRH